MRPWFLYVITNVVNGKRYVGITQSIDKRFREHFTGHGSKLVWQAIKKYGKSKLTFEVWYEGSEERIKELETQCILALCSYAGRGYNLTLGGDGSVGRKHSDETIQKMRASHLGKKQSEIHKKRKADKLRGTKRPSIQGSRNPRARRVLVNGVEYPCIRDAATAVGLKPVTLWTKFSKFNKSGEWPTGWAYL